MPDGAPTSNAMERLRRARGFVFDLDGTLALGDPKGHGLRPLPGTQELLVSLEKNGTPFVVFTNGTLRTPRETAQKLRDAGFPVSDEQAMTPSSVAAAYFARRKISPVLVLGCEAVWRPLVEAGVEVILEDEYQGGAKAVYVGWYREFTMVSIEKAFDAIMKGAPLYSASNVPFFASSKGRALGTSFAICAALRGLTKKPAIVLGKPSSHALKEASRKLGVPVGEMAIIGDDPLCEIRLARYGDALAVGVTTGTASRAQFETQTGNYRPDIVIDGLAELGRLLQSA
jgi:4-nitrophenyl phosphatase